MPGTPAAQTDDVVRSATILPGVPLPVWALPEGPIAPEPTPEPTPEPAAEIAAPAISDEPAALGFEDTVAFGAYSAPMALAANGPAPMRAGWGFPGNETSTLDGGTVDASGGTDLDVTAEIATVPDDIAGLTELVPPPTPIDAPDPQTLVPAPGAGSDPVTVPGTAVTDDSSGGTGDADADASEPGRSRRPLVLVGALGAVLVAAAVAAFVWPGLLVSAEPETEALPVRPAPVVAPAQLVLAAPDQVGGLTRVGGAADAALAKAASTTPLPGLTAPVSGVYGLGTTPAVTVIAWRNGTALDATAIQAAFSGFTASAGAAVSDVVTVRVGGLPGQMRCGTTVVGATPARLCFWVDTASFGSVTVLRPASPEAGAETALAVRESVETKA